MLSDRAIASLGMRQPDQALIDADRAVSADPNNALVYLNRGMIKRLSGKFQDAIGDYDRSISINSKEANAYGERGQAYMSVTQLDKALVDFDQALSLNPASDVARAARGLALLMKGNSAEGLVDIKNALDRNPNNQMAELGQGLAMLVSGQYDRAIVALDQIVGKSAAYDGLARTLRARAYLAKNDTADAMTDLNSVLATPPMTPMRSACRGLAYSRRVNTTRRWMTSARRSCNARRWSGILHARRSTRRGTISRKPRTTTGALPNSHRGTCSISSPRRRRSRRSSSSRRRFPAAIPRARTRPASKAYSSPDKSAALPPAAAVLMVTVCSVAKRAR